MKLYHKDIYLPLELLKEVYEYFFMPLTMSNHAFDAAMQDVYGPFRIPRNLNYLLSEVIEIEVNEDNEVCKVIIRKNSIDDGTLDIVVVVALPSLVVKTAWQNEVDDKHINLCVDKYVPLPETENDKWVLLREMIDHYPLNPKYEGDRDVATSE